VTTILARDHRSATSSRLAVQRVRRLKEFYPPDRNDCQAVLVAVGVLGSYDPPNDRIRTICGLRIDTRPSVHAIFPHQRQMEIAARPESGQNRCDRRASMVWRTEKAVFRMMWLDQAGFLVFSAIIDPHTQGGSRTAGGRGSFVFGLLLESEIHALCGGSIRPGKKSPGGGI